MKKEKEFIKAYRYIASFFSNYSPHGYFSDSFGNSSVWGDCPYGKTAEEWRQNFDKLVNYRNKYLDDLFNGMGEVEESDRFSESCFKPIYIRRCQVVSYSKVSHIVLWSPLEKKIFKKPYDRPFVIFNTIRGNLGQGKGLEFDYIIEAKNFLV
jgi:hypothetical protein